MITAKSGMHAIGIETGYKLGLELEVRTLGKSSLGRLILSRNSP